MSIILLLAVLTVVAVIGGGIAFAIALARSGSKDYAAQGQVLPGVDTGAPAAWAGAHSPEALMHRRLVAAMQALRAQATSVSEEITAMDLRVELEQHALATDQRLIAAAALPTGARERALAEVEVSVVAIEQAAADLATQLGSASASSDVRALEDLGARIRGLGEGGLGDGGLGGGEPDAHGTVAREDGAQAAGAQSAGAHEPGASAEPMPSPEAPPTADGPAVQGPPEEGTPREGTA